MSSNLPSVTSPPWGSTTKRLVTLVAITVLYLVARQVSRAAWMSIVVAVVLAYLLTPVVKFFEHRLSWIKHFERRRTLSVVLTWLFVLGVFALVIGLIVPATVKQLRQFADDLPAMLDDTEQDLKAALGKPIKIGGYTLVPWDELEKMWAEKNADGETSSITTTLQDNVLSLANPALGVVGGAVSVLVSTVFALIMLFYLMRDGPVFVDFLVNAVPESYQGDVRRLLHELGLIWHAYLRGQVLLCLVVGLATYLVALVLGLPQPLLLGLVAGFLEFIPNLGPALAQIPAVLFALTTSSSTIPGLDAGLLYAIVVSLSYIAIQQLEAIFLVPRILGHSLDLHPFVVLVAIMIGAGLAGVLGIVLAAPITATLRLFGRYLRVKLLDEELFPAVPSLAAQQDSLVYRVMRYFLYRRYPVLPPEAPESRALIRSEWSGEAPDPSDTPGRTR